MQQFVENLITKVSIYLIFKKINIYIYNINVYINIIYLLKNNQLHYSTV